MIILSIIIRPHRIHADHFYGCRMFYEPCKMAEPIEMPLERDYYWAPRNHSHIIATARKQLNDSRGGGAKLCQHCIDHSFYPSDAMLAGVLAIT